MKKIAFFILILCLVSCKKDICTPLDDTLPMYGNIEKCKPQLLADEKFIKASVDEYGSRQEAADNMLRFAWKHLAEGNFDTATKRFNQAWLLDSLNADVYKGFANVMLEKGMDQESLVYFDRYLQLDSLNAEILRSSASVYINLYDESSDKDFDLLNESIARLRKAIAIEPDNARGYSLLTKAYAYKNERDSARKYLEITDRLDSDIIEREIRDYILR